MYDIKQVELAVRARLDELLKPAGITAIQYTALTVLRHRGAMSGAALARRSFVTPQSMADLLAALRRRGLITRGPDPTNRRQHIVAFASTGKGTPRAMTSRCASWRTSCSTPYPICSVAISVATSKPVASHLADRLLTAPFSEHDNQDPCVLGT